MGEILFLLALLAGTAYLYILTGTFPTNAMDNSGGAAMFPRFLLIALALLLFVRMLQILTSKTEKKKHFVFRELFRGSTGVFLLGIVLYLLLFSILGYILTTLLYAVGMISYCYYKKFGNFGTVKSAILRVACSLAGTMVLYWFFSDVLVVRLPAGVLGF